MKLNLGISAMLVTAVLAGAVGGAVALSAAADPVPAPSAPVTLHQVAEEATPTPAPASGQNAAAPADSEPSTVSSVGSTSDPEASTVDSGGGDSAPVSDPAPIVEPVAPKGETASEAADRAKAEADRAKAEADRAAQLATTPAPSPEPVPVETPKPECTDGDALNGVQRRHADGSVWQEASFTCRNGKWEQTTPAKKVPEPTPEPVIGGAEEEVPAGKG